MKKKLSKALTDATLKINSEDIEKVKLGLEIYAKEGKKDILTFLFDILLDIDESSEKWKLIIQFLYDLKEQDVVTELINAIEQEKYSSIRVSLLSVCWQSSLDFSSHFNNYIALCKEASAHELLEITTIIDNMDADFSEEDVHNAIFDLQDIQDISEDDLHQVLLSDLIEVLKSLTLQSSL